MTITLGYYGGNYEDATVNRVTYYFDSAHAVTTGSLIVVCVSIYNESSSGYTAAALTKTAGDATIGSVALDVEKILADTGGGAGYYGHNIIFSFLVTNGGALQLQFATGSFYYTAIAAAEFKASAGWDSTYLEDADGATNSTGAPATPDMTSAGSAVFVGCVTFNSGSSLTITPDDAFSQIYEIEDASAHMVINAMYRIVASGTTDAASWTSPTTVPWMAAGAVYKEVGGAAADPEGALVGGKLTHGGLLLRGVLVGH